MNFSTPVNTDNTTASSSLIYKGFKELTLALWKNPKIAESVLHSPGGTALQPIVRHYTLLQASHYLDRTEATLRLFLWENGIAADGQNNGSPVFSEDLLDLIESYGYLFEYAKKWRQTGHPAEADKLLKEAREVFGLPSFELAAPAASKRKEASRPSVILEYTEDWLSLPEELEASPVYI